MLMGNATVNSFLSHSKLQLAQANNGVIIIDRQHTHLVELKDMVNGVDLHGAAQEARPRQRGKGCLPELLRACLVVRILCAGLLGHWAL